MAYDTEGYTDFADSSFSWDYIERPALDRGLAPIDYYDGVKVLDIGSGSGRIVNYHVKRGADPGDITAIEPEPEFCDAIEQHFDGWVICKNERVEDAVVRMGHYEVISAVMVMRYLDDDALQDTLDKVKRALVHGGTFVMLDAHPARIALKDGGERYFEEGERSVQVPWGGEERYHYRTIPSYIEAIQKADLGFVALDECPIAPGAREDDKLKYVDYAQAPSRFMIVAADIV